MYKNYNLSDEQISKVKRLEFLYTVENEENKILDENELYFRLINLDNSLRKKAFLFSFFEGLLGFILLITGYNLLTFLTNSFLQGIMFFSIGAIMLAVSLPLYQLILKKDRKKYAPVVLAITNVWN